MSPLINSKQAAQILGLNVPALLGLVKSRKIPHFRYGTRTVRYSEEAIRAFRVKSLIDAKDQQQGEGS